MMMQENIMVKDFMRYYIKNKSKINEVRKIRYN